jgi:hypothetical protein
MWQKRLHALIPIPALCIACLLIGGSPASDDEKSPLALREEYDSLFADAPDNRLLELGNEDSSSVAIQARWEFVRRVKARVAEDRPAEEYMRSLRRFLGFVEGRLRVSVPSWWERLLVRGRVDIDPIDEFQRPVCRLSWLPNQLQPEDRYSKKYQFAGSLDAIWGHNELQVSAIEGGTVIVEWQERSISIPSKVIADARREFRVFGIAAIACPDKKTVVVLHSYGGGSGTALCYDDVTGNEVWKAQFWGDYLHDWRSGVGFYNWIELVHSDGVVYVFGALDSSLYIEGLSVRDGTSVLRFSTGL